jgi:hypothetical protein
MERFGVDSLCSDTREVEVWDISSLVRRIKMKPELERENIRTLTSWTQLFKNLRLLNRNKVFFILYLNLSIRSLPLFVLLSRGRFRSMINNSNIPIILEKHESNVAPKRHPVLRFLNLIIKREMSFELLGNYLLRRCIHLFPIEPPTYMFCGGKKSVMNGHFWKRSKLIWGHHLDYETARKIPNELPENLVPGDFAVFLDNGTPTHPDIFTYSNSIPENRSPQMYYPSVNDLLGKIEDTFKTKIVIAAHPRWKFKEMENPYQGRTIVGFSTPLLVKHAKFVICHVSTSAVYAVMFRKPLIFIQSSAHTREYVLSSAEIFGKMPHVPYANETFLPSELIVNNEIYDNLFKQFLTTWSEPNQSNWSIIGDLVDREFGQAG